MTAPSATAVRLVLSRAAPPMCFNFPTPLTARNTPAYPLQAKDNHRRHTVGPRNVSHSVPVIPPPSQWPDPSGLARDIRGPLSRQRRSRPGKPLLPTEVPAAEAVVGRDRTVLGADHPDRVTDQRLLVEPGRRGLLRRLTGLGVAQPDAAVADVGRAETRSATVVAVHEGAGGGQPHRVRHVRDVVLAAEADRAAVHPGADVLLAITMTPLYVCVLRAAAGDGRVRKPCRRGRRSWCARPRRRCCAGRGRW